MARKRKRKTTRGRYGLDPESHGERSRVGLAEIRRLQRLMRSKMSGTPDCIHAASILRALAREEGAYWIDIHDSEKVRGASYAMDKIFDRFVRQCVVHPRNRG